MPLVSMKKLLQHAQKNSYAVGYFEAFNMDAMLGVLDAAENKNSPVIIGFGGQFLNSGRRAKIEDVSLYGALAKEAARHSKIPAAALLNEADSEDMVYRGMQSGFGAVMYQKDGEAFSKTLEITARICRVAHALDIDVESEIGELPCADLETGSRTKGANTDVSRAKYFVEQTKIDALAVAVGNVHLLESGKAEMDYELLNTLSEQIPVPLVLHGGTGLSGEDFQKAISCGISKINIGTALKRAYIEAAGRFYKEKDIAKINPHITIGWGGEEDMIDCGRAAVAKKAGEYMDAFKSSGKALLVR
ncbi:MAG: class II fructose-bisphosphate aldolase [Oscillospiraceae bacterium]|nr:class II fructose-bisphosphate aldolase [Oscillospiraceae bacterium]